MAFKQKGFPMIEGSLLHKRTVEKSTTSQGTKVKTVTKEDKEGNIKKIKHKTKIKTDEGKRVDKRVENWETGKTKDVTKVKSKDEKTIKSKTKKGKKGKYKSKWKQGKAKQVIKRKKGEKDYTTKKSDALIEKENKRAEEIKKYFEN